MTDTFTFELVSPEKLLLSGDAEIVTVPGVEGDMGVLVNHAPVMTSLRPGLIELKMGDGTESTFYVRGGFADITPESVTVLAEFAVAKEDVTQEMFEQQKQGDEEKKHAAITYLDQLTRLEPALLSA